MKRVLLGVIIAVWPAAARAACSFLECTLFLSDGGVVCTVDQACSSCDPQCCGCGGASANCYPPDDAGLCADGHPAHASDGGASDAGPSDGGKPGDAGTASDAGTLLDAGIVADAGQSGADAGPPGVDAGSPTEAPRSLTVGCGCTASGGPLVGLALLLVLRRKRIK